MVFRLCFASISDGDLYFFSHPYGKNPSRCLQRPAASSVSFGVDGCVAVRGGATVRALAKFWRPTHDASDSDALLDWPRERWNWEVRATRLGRPSDEQAKIANVIQRGCRNLALPFAFSCWAMAGLSGLRRFTLRSGLLVSWRKSRDCGGPIGSRVWIFGGTVRRIKVRSKTFKIPSRKFKLGEVVNLYR